PGGGGVGWSAGRPPAGGEAARGPPAGGARRVHGAQVRGGGGQSTGRQQVHRLQLPQPGTRLIAASGWSCRFRRPAERRDSMPFSSTPDQEIPLLITLTS